ncbi:hypothetical protein NA57DRAFT_79883 [Rhizodiscina lignyota]|uniref:Prion-inhibition and propagation HeLo domain-containing protein n=1 Tax=Rhizodiscina lignyota TaxID=1504668 RepID=A0A9P4I9Z1_9PEZI|nr:hypothetical protein NA57DRAFT_79883 [Rhizodiscina lignyota]
MAEVIGAIASGITLATLFKSCLDAFDLFQTGRNIDTDLKRLVVRLNIEKCRLYTWGEAMGLIVTPPTGQVRLPDSSPHQDLVKEALEEILQLLSDSSKIKSRYGCETVLVSSKDDEVGPVVDLAASFARFTVSGQSQQSSTKRLVAKTRWAISDRKKFAELIIEVRSFVDGLQEITKSIFTVARQEGMLRFGIQQITSLDTLEIVAEACEADYPDISDAASVKIDVLTIATGRRREIEGWVDDVDDEDETTVSSQAHDEAGVENTLVNPNGFPSLPSMLSPETELELSREAQRMATELERAREESAKAERDRAKAERNRKNMEEELEALTASLFEEANTMVAAARKEKEDLEVRYEQLAKNFEGITE